MRAIVGTAMENEGGNESVRHFEVVRHTTDLFVLNLISVIDSLIILMGTVGNLTSFYLLTRKRLRPVSSMRYLAALTVVDTVCLYGWYLSSVYRQLNGDNLRRLENLSPVLCKLVAYVSFSSLQLSSVLLCMLTIDRFLIIVASKWRQKYANAQFANWVIMVLVFSVMALNIIIPIRLGNLGMVKYHVVKHLSSSGSSTSSSSSSQSNHFDSVLDFSNNQASASSLNANSNTNSNSHHAFLHTQNTVISSSLGSEADNFMNAENFTTMCHCYDDNDPILGIWHKVHLIIYSLAPFPLLCILNFIVVRKTRDAAKSAAKINSKNLSSITAGSTTTTAQSGVSKSGQRFVTRLLLFLTISFLLTTLPSTIVYTYWHREILRLAHGRVYLNLLNTLQFSRHSSNWIIYIYSSSFMREELKRCLACISEGDMGDEELARNVLAQRPSVALELLRQLEAVGNNNTTADLDSLYLKFYMQQQLQRRGLQQGYTRTPMSDSEGDEEEDEEDDDGYSSNNRSVAVVVVNHNNNHNLINSEKSSEVNSNSMYVKTNKRINNSVASPSQSAGVDNENRINRK